IGRTHFEHRAALLVTDREKAAGDLEAIARGEMPASAERGSTDAARRPMTAFLFSGQGSQYVGMGRALFEAYPIFRSAVERCAAVLDRSLERPFLDVLFGQDAEAIHATAYAQTTLFVLQMALTELWASFG